MEGQKNLNFIYFQLQIFDTNRDGKLQLSEMSRYIVRT